MAAKYKQYYKNMIMQHKQLFADFALVHDKFVSGHISQEKFNNKGLEVVNIVRDWDRRLCHAMGKGIFSKYSEKLSEKFWDEVRKNFSHIDQVGVRR